jgi:hypothetical protein
VELNFTPAELLILQGYAPLFDAALSVQVEETADYQAKSTGQKDAEEEVHKQYVSCQDYIRGEMVFASDPDKEYLNERFDIYGELPTTREGLVKVARTMLTGFDSIDVELPSVTLPDSLFESLRTKLTALTAISEDDIKDELSEQKSATAAKNVLRTLTGERLLRRVYHRAVAFWGDDDPRLLEIGILPKSQIWTPGMPGGGGGGVEETEWGGKVEGLTVELDPIGNIFIRCKKMKDAVSYKILRAVIKIGTTPPFAPFPEYRTGIPPLEDNFAYGDTNWEKGNSYYYQIVAVNAANEMSEPSDPESVDYPLA